MSDYGCEAIQVLKGLEAVRRRPGMYVGDTADGSGMHAMLHEVIANAVDEHLGGAATHVRVTLEGDTITIEDDGRGIPVDVIPRTPPISVLELVFSTLHCGRSPSSHGRWYRSMYGLGLPVVNALSAWLEVEVCRGGRRYHQRHERGEPCGPVRDLGPTSRTGTSIRFTPDFTIYARRPWDREAIGLHLRAMAALAPGFTTVFTAAGQHEVVRTPGGLVDLARHLAGGSARHEPVHIHGNRHDVGIDAALVWTDRPGPSLHGYVNGRMAERGVHLDAIAAGVRRGIRRHARERLAGVHSTALDEVTMPGLVAVVHAIAPEPRYSYAGGLMLSDTRIRGAVRGVIASHLSRALADDPALRQALRARLPCFEPAPEEA